MNLKIHELIFYIFLFLLPIQTRILYKPDLAYIGWYFNYHLALFVYLTDLILILCFIMWLAFDRPFLNGPKKIASARQSKALLEAEAADSKDQIASSPNENPLQAPRKYDFRLFWLILAFFLLIIATLFHVKHLYFGLYEAIKWVEVLFLLYYVSQVLRTKSQFIIASTMLFVSAIIQSIIGLFQFHVQHTLGLSILGEYIAPLGTSGLANLQIGSDKLIRAYGTMPHPNILGAFLVFGLITGLFIVSSGFGRLQPSKDGDLKTSATQYFGFLGIGVILLGIFVTFSRSAWFGTAIVLLSFVWYFWTKNRRNLALSIILVTLVSCATILLLAPQTLKSRVIDANSVSILDRVFFDQLGIGLIIQNPLSGTGVGNYIYALSDKYHLDAWQYQPPHNIFIFIAAELGVVGLILFILILFEIFSRVNNVPREVLTFSIILTGLIFLLMGQFDHYFVTIQQGRLMFFTVLGMIAALPNLKENNL
ncbi:MAG: O-antigen ligase family protein [Candidatus Doudnabacteria bacterium]